MYQGTACNGTDSMTCFHLLQLPQNGQWLAYTIDVTGNEVYSLYIRNVSVVSAAPSAPGSETSRCARLLTA